MSQRVTSFWLMEADPHREQVHFITTESVIANH
jgi:hypothetical protein